MEKRTDQIVVLQNNKKYYIMQQIVYREENYFVVAEATDDEQDLKEKFAILHETIEDGESYIEFCKDAKILAKFIKYVGKEKYDFVNLDETEKKKK